jgi:hypothetical protein
MSAAVAMRLNQLHGRQVPVLPRPEQDRPDGNCL